MPTGRRLYCYFRVAREHEPAAVAAVRAMQALVAQADSALDCDLLRRADAPGAAHVVLMEVYSRRGGVAPATQARIEDEAARRLARWIVGSRHVEVFEPCA